MNQSLAPQSTTNPLLRDYDRLSPAQSLDLIVGYDDEGWAIYQGFGLGQIVASQVGNTYKVIGFTLDNEIIVKPYGLGHDPAIKSMCFQSEGLKVIENPICGSMID